MRIKVGTGILIKTITVEIISLNQHNVDVRTASQDLAHSPLTRAKHQFLNARDAFDKSVRLQEYVFDEAKGIPEFLSDSFGISRILLLFPRGTPFLDELIRSNRVQVYSQLAKTTEKPESSQRTIFGIGFNRSGRKTLQNTCPRRN